MDRTSRRLARFGLFHHQGVRCQAHGTLRRGGGERRRRPWRLSQREHPSEGGTHCSSGMRAVGRYPAAHAHSALSPSDPWWVPWIWTATLLRGTAGLEFLAESCADTYDIGRAVPFRLSTPFCGRQKKEACQRNFRVPRNVRAKAPGWRECEPLLTRHRAGYEIEFMLATASSSNSGEVNYRSYNLNGGRLLSPYTEINEKT